MRVAPRISSFLVGGPSYSAWSGGAISGTGCMVPQSFATGGNWSYPKFWAVTGDLRYPGYKTSTVAPDPFVERAVENALLTGGRIGSYMLVQALLWDSAERLWC
jgi:hypothetical protein